MSVFSFKFLDYNLFIESYHWLPYYCRISHGVAFLLGLEVNVTHSFTLFSPISSFKLPIYFHKIYVLYHKGTKSKDNYYLWVSQENVLLSSCMLSKDEEVRPWHQKLGHLNLQGMKKAISVEAIRGIPKLQITEGSICGECQVGKQTQMSHPRLEHQGTSKVLELLHIDLMGPMQVASIGDKRYVLTVVDDFSRFTWMNFIREK